MQAGFEYVKLSSSPNISVYWCIPCSSQMLGMRDDQRQTAASAHVPAGNEPVIAWLFPFNKKNQAGLAQYVTSSNDEEGNKVFSAKDISILNAQLAKMDPVKNGEYKIILFPIEESYENSKFRAFEVKFPIAKRVDIAERLCSGELVADGYSLREATIPMKPAVIKTGPCCVIL